MTDRLVWGGVALSLALLLGHLLLRPVPLERGASQFIVTYSLSGTGSGDLRCVQAPNGGGRETICRPDRCLRAGAVAEPMWEPCVTIGSGGEGAR